MSDNAYPPGSIGEYMRFVDWKTGRELREAGVGNVPEGPLIVHMSAEKMIQGLHAEAVLTNDQEWKMLLIDAANFISIWADAARRSIRPEEDD